MKREPLARYGGTCLSALGGRGRQISGLHSKYQASQSYIVRPLSERDRQRQRDRQTHLGTVDEEKS